jgi:hypothetical protein
VLTGTDARRARALIGAIVRRGRPPSSTRRTSGLGGDAAWALGLEHLFPGANEGGAPLCDAIQAIVDGGSHAAYGDGYAGAGAVIAHLGERAPLDREDRDAILELIDDGVTRCARRADARAPHDLLHGVAGFGLYLAERAATPRVRAALARVVARIARGAERAGDGLAWRSPASELGAPLRPRFASGYYDLGLAHGAAGVVVVLARIHAAGVAVAEARRLIEGAVAWLGGVRAAHARGPLPGLLGPDGATFPARSGWCSGDLGVARALVIAGRALDRPAWISDGVELARACCGRDGDVDVDDAALCHGSAGVALLLHRFFHETGAPAFADAARRWYRRTIDSPRCERPDHALLGGELGVALALHAAIEDREPRWDRLLGISGGVR